MEALRKINLLTTTPYHTMCRGGVAMALPSSGFGAQAGLKETGAQSIRDI
jgi:hypothetical protein